ncbi:hypothetical protein BpHYR1_047378 [Brachionus plicatilis]|uniref:Uncharacterized protein n=1 Tax=Brachionus plicatilis TaxID=10195 RepID=A0A3M7QTH4_BRAPC|nr:hypothetical protein BpHYR1_047378 [Brachionus plicatilis]
MSSASILENNFNDTVEDAEPLAKNKRSTGRTFDFFHFLQDSEDELLSKRPRIESDQNEAFDSESKSCENCGNGLTRSPIFLIIFVTRLAAAGVNGTRDNSVNPINPIGQFFQPVSPKNHTDGLVMYFYKDLNPKPNT